MNKKPDKSRPSLRLKGYDYSLPGYYFFTFCVKRRKKILGHIIEGTMYLNVYGQIVKFTWFDLVNHVSGISLDAFVVMPDHVHGIVVILDVDNEPTATSKSSHKPLPEIIRQLKTFSAIRINKARKTAGQRVWQRNYYERIIRNNDELNRIRAYIINNPRGSGSGRSR
jgi:REP element-mobilizing transposase RayT